MNLKVTNIVVLLLATAIVACCPCRFSRKNAKPLVGIEWHLVQLRGNDVSFPAEMFNVIFADNGSLAGIGACNRFTAPYSVTEKRGIDIGTIASTRRLCPNIESEQTMFRELDEATFYEIDGPMLLLLNNGEIRAIFQAKETDSK